MKIEFNPVQKVTKRHMDVLCRYIPVREDFQRKSYWVTGQECKGRKSTCQVMLDLIMKFIDDGLFSSDILDDILTSVASEFQTPLFVRVTEA